MSITAIPVIVVVMIVRLLLKRLPKRFSYVLWALVAFRLIVPVSISSEISIFNLSARISNLNNRIETVNTKKNLEKSDDADIQIVVPDIQGEVKAHEEQVFTDEGKILKGFETATGTEHNSTYIVDENVISALGNEMKKDYSRSLLAFASNKRQQFISPLAFGEENTMKRVKNILQYKKPGRWKIVVGMLVITFTMAACATDAKDNENVNEIVNENEKTEKAETMPVTVENMTQQSEEVIIDIDHQPAQWAPNSMYDLELFTLDFADQDKIIFHISSGLFEYDLSNEKLKEAWNCRTPPMRKNMLFAIRVSLTNRRIKNLLISLLFGLRSRVGGRRNCRSITYDQLRSEQGS